MDIEFKDVPELMRVFRKFFPNYFHIKFEWTSVLADINGHAEQRRVIRVEVNDTEKGGAAVEHWLLSYARVLLKDSKEMDKCAKRWLDAFQNIRRESTLDILGHKNVEAVVKVDPANNNTIH